MKPTHARYWVVVLALALAMIMYIQRVAISQAIVPIAIDLHLNKEETGLVLGAFGLPEPNWLGDFKKRRPDVSQDAIDKYFHSLWRAQPDFLYSVPRDFIKNCHTPILVLPDDTASHPLQSSIDVASLAPNSDITVFPWREPEELRQRMIGKVRSFLKSHVPMKAAAQ